MLYNAENIALQNLQILYYAWESAPLSAQMWCIFPCIIQCRAPPPARQTILGKEILISG